MKKQGIAALALACMLALAGCGSSKSMNDIIANEPSITGIVEDLISKTEEEMMKVRNLGRKSLEEVINKLAMMGLSLASEENN